MQEDQSIESLVLCAGTSVTANWQIVEISLDLNSFLNFRRSANVHRKLKEVLYFLSIGVLFGFTAGISPGPLLALVITETLEHGIGSGIKVALAPVITDVPIIVVTLFVFTQLSDFGSILGTISLVGGCYVLYMGYESLRFSGGTTSKIGENPKSLFKGVITNALSPHPYLFWLSVGAPTVAKSLSTSIVAPFLFIGGFYLFLVGAKIILAIMVGKSKFFMSEKTYVYTMKLLGFALITFSVVLFIDGLTLLGLIET